jgi:hypothetical protein
MGFWLEWVPEKKETSIWHGGANQSRSKQRKRLCRPSAKEDEGPFSILFFLYFTD